jgi:hypothetical protein
MVILPPLPCSSRRQRAQRIPTESASTPPTPCGHRTAPSSSPAGAYRAVIRTASSSAARRHPHLRIPAPVRAGTARRGANMGVECISLRRSHGCGAGNAGRGADHGHLASRSTPPTSHPRPRVPQGECRGRRDGPGGNGSGGGILGRAFPKVNVGGGVTGPVGTGAAGAASAAGAGGGPPATSVHERSRSRRRRKRASATIQEVTRTLVGA